MLLSAQTPTATAGLQNSSLLYGALSSSRDELGSKVHYLDDDDDDDDGDDPLSFLARSGPEDQRGSSPRPCWVSSILQGEFCARRLLWSCSHAGCLDISHCLQRFAGRRSASPLLISLNPTAWMTRATEYLLMMG